MSNNQKLLLNIKNPLTITNVQGDFINKGEFLLDVIIGKINNIEIISESVLLVEFEAGEIRLDIDKKFLVELSKVINNEL